MNDREKCLREACEIVNGARNQAYGNVEENFDMNSIYMILADSNMPIDTANEMLDKINDVDGIQFALGIDTALKSGIPQEILPNDAVPSHIWDLTVH